MSYNRKRLHITLIFLVILSLFAGLTDWHASAREGESSAWEVPAWVPFHSFWNSFDYHLGLDLKGGTHLVYLADTSAVEDRDKESAVEGVRDVIERRVNAFGVSEPLVQTNQTTNGNYRIIIELAGVSDVNQAIAMIGETPLLEFKEENIDFTEQRTLTPEEQAELDSYNEGAKQKAQQVLERALAGEDFAVLAREFSEDSSAEQGGDLGWANRGDFVPEFDQAIFEDLAVGEILPSLVETQFGYHIIKKVDERQKNEISPEINNDEEQLNPVTAVVGENGEVSLEPAASDDEYSNIEVLSSHILIAKKTASDILPPIDQWKNTELSGKNLKRSEVQYDQNTGDPEVSLEFDDEGAKLFEEITGRNVGQPVAIYLDGTPISVPNVNEKITGGRAVITGRFNLQEAKDLVQRLNAGALPVPIELISQQTVGPTLGRISVAKSLQAGLIGLLLVALFMIVIYRLPGLLAVAALAIYTILVLMVFKLIPVTLTLAGIAGFILSIGMAVDANVLIFERMKEELRHGRGFSGAVEEGFKRAWTSIRDSNVSSLLTCFILYWFGTSVIRGFAFTLAIGIIISMFSAITITRSFLRLLKSSAMDKVSWLVFGKKNNNE